MLGTEADPSAGERTVKSQRSRISHTLNSLVWPAVDVDHLRVDNFDHLRVDNFVKKGAAALLYCLLLL